MKIKALVAVRGGSQRIKNKNIRPFSNSSLLEIKLEQLKRIQELDGIVVNSDDESMLNIAKKMGCETVEREKYFASSSVCMSEVYKNMAENIDADAIVYANVTNPLIKDDTVSKAIQTYISNIEKYDSLNSAHLIKEFMYFEGKPINYDLKKQPRSQDLPNIAALNFAISIVSKEKMISSMNIVGDTPYIYIIDEYEAIDIDNMIDFEIAEYLYNMRNNIQ